MFGSCYDIRQFSIEPVPHCQGEETAPLRVNGAVSFHITGEDTRYTRVWQSRWALPTITRICAA